MRVSILALTALVSAAPAAAIEQISSVQSFGFETANRNAPVKVQTGQRGDLSYTARSMVVGQTATAGVGGGDPVYFPSSNKSGTVALVIDRGNGSFICSGSVIGNGMSIATAAHCVSDGFGTPNPVNTTAYFYNGDPTIRTASQSEGVAIPISQYFVHQDYTGEVIDQNDIAILRLSQAAPGFVQRYELHTDPILNGTQFNVAGYGERSTIGGAVGPNATTGFLREGDNIYDYYLGDPTFGTFFTNGFFGTADVELSLISDFDNGLEGNDAAGLIAGSFGSSAFDDKGLGAREVGIAPGDSGGPGFINGKLASINSYGLTFGTNFGDVDSSLNASWGEFSGFVPIWIHSDFIALATAVPEPESWAMLIVGFGLVGSSLRRRRALA